MTQCFPVTWFCSHFTQWLLANSAANKHGCPIPWVCGLPGRALKFIRVDFHFAKHVSVCTMERFRAKTSLTKTWRPGQAYGSFPIPFRKERCSSFLSLHMMREIYKIKLCWAQHQARRFIGAYVQILVATARPRMYSCLDTLLQNSLIWEACFSNELLCGKSAALINWVFHNPDSFRLLETWGSNHLRDKSISSSTILILQPTGGWLPSGRRGGACSVLLSLPSSVCAGSWFHVLPLQSYFVSVYFSLFSIQLLHAAGPTAVLAGSVL